MIHILFSFMGLVHANPNPWPPFYGDYPIHKWTCESTMKDAGCAESARIRIEDVNGVSTLTVFDKSGRAIRSNDLVEKANKGAKYSFFGDDSTAGFLVEAFDSKGVRYFYNMFKLEYSDSHFTFVHAQESNLGGFSNSLRREFGL